MRTSRAALVISAVVVIAALKLGRELLVPFALAVLLSFLLAPLVIWLQRFLGRIAAVVVVTAILVAATVGVGWLVLGQAAELAGKLPEHKHKIIERIKTVRAAVTLEGGTSQAVEEITKAISPTPAEAPAGPSPAATTVPVAEPVVKVAAIQQPSLTAALGPWIGSLVAFTGTGAVVVVFVIFMLLYYEDHRDRILRLFGTGRLNETMTGMHDAARRVSRYLVTQSIVNASHGLAVGIGLYLLGVPAALFFGLSSALLRFVPYVGPIIAAAMPIVLSFAVFDGWTAPLTTLGFFIVLEILSNNVLEPWLFGSSTGLTPMAVILAAVFWTWLWGALGLVLSVPLTVCLVVLGKHFAPLGFLNILLTDQPALEPKGVFYERLLAIDFDGGLETAKKYLEGRSLQDVYDDVILPALALAENDKQRGELEEPRATLILKTARDIIEELGETIRPLPPASTPLAILCFPARDEADELAGRMFAQILAEDGRRATTVSAVSLTGEMIEQVAMEEARLVCISALPPSAVSHSRNLYKRLRAQFENLNIIVGLWTMQGDSRGRIERPELEDGVLCVNSLAAGREAVHQLAESLVLTSVPSR